MPQTGQQIHIAGTLGSKECDATFERAPRRIQISAFEVDAAERAV